MLGAVAQSRRSLRWIGILLVPVFPVLFGCSSVLGLDDFRRGTGLPRGASCAAGEVSIDGACARVGVPEDECGEGFVADGGGGCDAVLPDADCSGSLARPGDLACVPILPCDGEEPRVQGSSVWFVRADAAAGGDGHRASPFNRVSDAIRAAAGIANAAVEIDAGDYVENVVVDRPLRLVGRCPDRTRIIAERADQPVVTVRADGSRISGLEITGGSAGVVLDGAADVQIELSRISHLGGPGVRIDGGGVSITATDIEDTVGAGVAIYGGTASIARSTIRRTRAGIGGDACGVCARPSGQAPSVYAADGLPYRDPRASPQGSLDVVGSLIEDAAGSGVSVLGVRDARITRTAVRRTGLDLAPGMEIGINAEERPFGFLRASVQIRQSAITGVTRAGIRARNADVHVDRSTVKDITGEDASGNGRCLGNGVRLLWDREPNDVTEPALSLSRSAIARTHETGILVEGASARVERTVVRDTRPDRCARDDLGDGVAGYGHEFAPASVEVVESRVEDSARAPVVTFGRASGALRDSVLVGRHASIAKEIAVVGTSCAATVDDPLETCVAEGRRLSPALLGGNGCDPDDDTVCIDGCSLDGGIPPAERGTILSPALRFWIVDHDEIAPASGDRVGCAELEGLPPDADLLRAVAVPPEPGFVDGASGVSPQRGFAPAIGNVRTGARDSSFPLSLAGALSIGTATTAGELSPLGDPAPSHIDLNSAPLLAVAVCRGNPAQRPLVADACRSPGSRLPGVSVALDTDHRAYYPTSAIALAPDGTAATIDAEIGSLALFVNVPPGERRIRLTSADPARVLNCTSDTGVGWQTASPTTEPNVYSFRVTTGFVNGLSIFCD